MTNHYTDVCEETIESLRQRNSDLVTGLEACDEQVVALRQQLAATADLKDVRLCEKNPVGAVLVDKDSREGVMFYSGDMIPDPSTIKDRFELIMVYEAWEPKI